MVLWKDLNGRHLDTDQCANEVEKKWRRLAAEEMRESAARPFPAYSRPLETVALFKYLGRILTTPDEDYPVVVNNPQKAWRSWDGFPIILVREGASPRVSGMFFKTVVQAVLLFGAEIWVMTPHIDGDLGGSQHRVA